MLTMQNLIDKITSRYQSRENLKSYIREYSGSERKDIANIESACMFCEILDDLLLQKLQNDKVVEGILKDIQGNTAIMAEKQLQNLITGHIN